MEWLECRGIPLKTEIDGRMFPESNNSQSIIDCFLAETKRLEIQIELGCGVKKLQPKNQQWQMDFIDTAKEAKVVDKIIIATGGSPKRSGLDWLKKLGYKIIKPVPSLFTFNMPNESVKELMWLR